MRCYRCMKEFGDEYEVCPHCGYIHSNDRLEPFQLPPGTVLQNRYWIGVMVGYGGFGITYKAYDTKLNVVVAIKEYYPSGLASRAGGTTKVLNNIVDHRKEFEDGLNRFIEEARTIAKFSEHPNIVKVYHFFRENETAYIVMEYLDGITLRYFLSVNGNKTTVLYAKEIILAVATALEGLHKEHIIHRDVSPDNIFLCSDGKIKLIDFGCARLSNQWEEQRDIVVKQGYAPPEQYDKGTKQGNYTDLYALGATFYRAITGEVPSDALERMKEDRLKRIKDYNIDVPTYVENAILKAMALDSNDRFSNVREFIDVLLKHKIVKVPKSAKEKMEHRQKMMFTGVCIVLLCMMVGLGVGIIRLKTKEAGKDVPVVYYWQEQEDTWICNETNHYDGEIKLLQEFVHGEIPYIWGSLSEEKTIREAVYGSLSRQNKEAYGVLQIAYIEE